ncbi:MULTISPECIES: penicillin-binding protein 2 [Rhodanobacter]|uniref:penicillin-binding protein 2 n=1 Tax=Rhodanobacter TaxID=75309 RepID=UPI0003FC83A9|nr:MULTISPECIES: penicillin-binding protein 2 [Rhodanobacter]KZC20612.1 penicillin-binding protein 2 [Rhodanobacter denitrificans]UJJ51484.1 penicillin-binding protein 2 [Rhodanobacter denitrificans]UJJ59734.1 penicillin-binding protein 2 [Rhodanobacter denitrificans]UJM94230.1 penicillin-binding protein 2 [Rhodanobacter denitrificans]UJM97759.1 penicillin-binding protein 2 [Rhodanobacter denitrificans]
MKPRRSIKDPRGESLLFRRRALAGFVLIVLCLCLLVGRFVFLQVLHHDEFVTRSQANRVKPRAIPPARGLIYDRNGVLLADNVPAFRLEVVPEQVKDMPALLERLGQVVPLDQDDLDAFRKQLRQSRRFESVPLKLRLSEDEIARFAVNRWRFPGVDVVPYLTRRYPFGGLFAHVVGYVGRIDADDLERLDPQRYQGTSHVGRSGIERSYENILHGTPGYELLEVNADGRTQRVLETHAPTPGRNLYLSLDVRLQKAAEAAFDGRPGAAVAIDPRNGQVLAMVSVPSFDPNLFVNGISQADYAALTNDPDKPLYNRALRGVYPPGSTVKPLIGLAGLETGMRTPQDSVVSTGVFYIPGQQRGYRDDQRGGVGRVDLVGAIEQSVNTYFYKLALDMGIDRLSEYMGKFGFGRPTGIDLIGESSGVLPSREWKAANLRQPWYPGETVIAGIGQGFWAVTPLQLSHAIATFAGHGIPYAPRVVMATQDGVNAKPQALANPPSGPSLIRKPSDWDVVNQGMQQVIYGARGTGRKLGVGFPYLMAGKSGTAERFSRTSEAYDTNRNTAYLATRHRAWFVAYAPADNPQVAVAAILESGAWGAEAAGPIVRAILDTWLAGHGGVIADAKRLPVSVAPLAPAAVPAGNVSPDAGVEDSEPLEDLPAQATSSGGTP